MNIVYSDNGGEYIALQDYLSSQGIEWEYTAPYAPQQNGVAERLNRTLVETTRTLLTQSGLSEEFWGEAIVTAASLRNITSAKKLNGMTPSEAITGRTPNTSHLRIFGCEVWFYNNTSQKTKLDARGNRGILLRCLSHKNYRIWDLQKQKVQHVRHVKFNETIFPGRTTTSKGAARVCAKLQDLSKRWKLLDDTALSSRTRELEMEKDGSEEELLVENIISDENTENENNIGPDEILRDGISQSDIQNLLEHIPEENTASSALATTGKSQGDGMYESAFMTHSEDLIPNSIMEAEQLPDYEKWKDALHAEL